MKTFIRIISVILCLFAIVSVIASASQEIMNDEIREKMNEISGLEALLEAQKSASDVARQKIDELSREIEENKEALDDVVKKMEVLSAEIDTALQLLQSYDELIVLKEDEIAEQEEALKRQEDVIIGLLRDDYENSSQGFRVLEALLNSKHIGDFLAEIQYMGSLFDYQEYMMNKYDSELIKYNGELYDLNQLKDEKIAHAAALEEKMSQYETMKADIEVYIRKLNNSQSRFDEFLSSSIDEEAVLSAAIKNAEKEKEKLIEDEKERIRLEEERKRREEEERTRREEEERKRREAEEAARKAREEAERKAREAAEKAAKEAAEKAAKEAAEKAAREAAEKAKAAEAEAKAAAESAAAYGKGYLWPLPVDSGYRLTGWFGYEPEPFGKGIRFHKAYDIGVRGGTTIMAAADGTVVIARYSSSYGNYVMIHHDNGYSTLYAHARKLCVSVGDVVRQGDKIAEVGTTGYSTGNHLHFEVIRPDGKTREDPSKYFPAILELHINDSPRYESLNDPRPTYWTP